MWSKGSGRSGSEPSLDEIRERVIGSLETLRPDHARSLNPCPYKVSLKSTLIVFTIKISHVVSYGQVSVSEKLYTFVHALWMQSAPIGELS